MGGFEGGLPHPLVTLGPGEWDLLVGGGSRATTVPAPPERIPVLPSLRVTGDIPDPWGHQKGTSDPADTRGERGDPLGRTWPVGVPGDTSWRGRLGWAQRGAFQLLSARGGHGAKPARR